MKSWPTISAIALAGFLVTGNTAFADCLCVAKGVRFSQGELVCLNLPAGPRLARCEKVLNNSSWKVLNENCQNTVEAEQEGDVALLAGEPPPNTGRQH